MGNAEAHLSENGHSSNIYVCENGCHRYLALGQEIYLSLDVEGSANIPETAPEPGESTEPIQKEVVAESEETSGNPETAPEPGETTEPIKKKVAAESEETSGNPVSVE